MKTFRLGRLKGDNRKLSIIVGFISIVLICVIASSTIDIGKWVYGIILSVLVLWMIMREYTYQDYTDEDSITIIDSGIELRLQNGKYLKSEWDDIDKLHIHCKTIHSYKQRIWIEDFPERVSGFNNSILLKINEVSIDAFILIKKRNDFLYIRDAIYKQREKNPRADLTIDKKWGK